MVSELKSFIEIKFDFSQACWTQLSISTIIISTQETFKQQNYVGKIS